MGSENTDFAIQVGAVIDMPVGHTNSTLPKRVTCQNSPKFHTYRITIMSEEVGHEAKKLIMT